MKLDIENIEKTLDTISVIIYHIKRYKDQLNELKWDMEWKYPYREIPELREGIIHRIDVTKKVIERLELRYYKIVKKLV